MEENLIGKACAYLDERRGERVTLEELSRAVGISPFHLQRSFKRAIGISPTDYQREQRLEQTKRLLANGSGVTDAVFGGGYGSVSRFYEKAASRLGMAARDYRAKGKGQTIAYCSFSTRLGTVLVAATGRGVCTIKLGDDAAALRRLLAAEFSEAELIEDAGSMKSVKEKILGFVAGDQSLAKVPVDVRGTVFQRKVWTSCAASPRGNAHLSADRARARRSARGTGRGQRLRRQSGCAPRPVPSRGTHRRGLGGYAWGLSRKKRLLDLERRKGKKQ